MSMGDTITRTFDQPPQPAGGSRAGQAPLPAGPEFELRRWRWIVGGALILLLALGALRLSLVEGLWRRVTIDGPSMAPALFGASYRVTCGDCRFDFRCDAEHVPSDQQAACPNCGYARNDLNEAKSLPAERVIIDRWPLLLRSLRRGETVACEAPGQVGELAVKRVAGLPGEQLAIRDGELYADGKQIQKTPAELRAVRVLVHDNDYQPQNAPRLPPRWRGAGDQTQWHATGGNWARPARESERAQWDWLEYEHWACTADERLRGKPTAVRDNDSYNQGETRRPLNLVRDVMLSCRVEASGDGELALAAADGKQRFAIVIEPSSRLVLQAGDEKLLELPTDFGFSRGAVGVEFGLCDRQILLAIAGRTLVRFPYERPAPSTPPMEAAEEAFHPLAIGLRGLAAEVSELRVWRDAYYLDPQGLARPWEQQAAPPSAGFTLLGDNPPVSIDSRQWEPAHVPVGAIRGLVYRPAWTRSGRVAQGRLGGQRPTTVEH